MESAALLRPHTPWTQWIRVVERDDPKTVGEGSIFFKEKGGG